MYVPGFVRIGLLLSLENLSNHMNESVQTADGVIKPYRSVIGLTALLNQQQEESLEKSFFVVFESVEY